jgi:hypothetical protein
LITVQSKLSLRVVADEPLLLTRLGTKWGEHICGRRGADRIFPGPGHDRVDAGAGPDVIVAADRSRDWTTCGPGRDTVIADYKDYVARDCERVRRTA